MQRFDFHEFFQCSGPVILPVIHVLDDARTAANVDHIIDAGLEGCFLINHDLELMYSYLFSKRFEAGTRISGSG